MPNKGKLIGRKPPLQPKHVWAIRTRLQLAGRMRDLALFDLAIDSKLRRCDVMSLKIEDVAPHSYAADHAIVRQNKTGRPVRFEITEQTRALGLLGKVALLDQPALLARQRGDGVPQVPRDFHQIEAVLGIVVRRQHDPPRIAVVLAAPAAEGAIRRLRARSTI